MSTVLRQERERRGLSLAEVADRCRIPQHFIEAIESGNADQVPKGPFFEVYRRRYQEFLAIPEAESASIRPRLEPRAHGAADETADDPEGELGQTRTITRQYDSVPLIRLVLAGFLITVALILGMKLVAGMLDRAGSSEILEGGVVTVPLTPVEPTPVDAASSEAAAVVAEVAAPPEATPPARPERIPGAPMRVHLRASDRVRVEVALDGQTVFDDWMEMGDTHDFHGAHEIAVDAGDLTRLAIHLDGQRVDPLGSLSQPRRLVFLREAE